MCDALVSRQSSSGSGAAQAKSQGKARQRASTKAQGVRQTGENHCNLAVLPVLEYKKKYFKMLH